MHEMFLNISLNKAYHNVFDDKSTSGLTRNLLFSASWIIAITKAIERRIFFVYLISFSKLTLTVSVDKYPDSDPDPYWIWKFVPFFSYVEDFSALYLLCIKQAMFVNEHFLEGTQRLELPAKQKKGHSKYACKANNCWKILTGVENNFKALWRCSDGNSTEVLSIQVVWEWLGSWTGDTWSQTVQSQLNDIGSNGHEMTTSWVDFVKWNS